MAHAAHGLPMHLQSLFDMMDFIAAAKPGFKPCFAGTYYVDAKSWSGAAYRFMSGESQSGRGNLIIRKCCDEACQAFDQYVDSPYRSVITKKMVDMRIGIANIVLTYSNDDSEISTVTQLKNIILALDMKIPKEILIVHGIIAPTPEPGVPMSEE